MKITYETDGINAYEYLYGYAERKAYEQGYEDGYYRRQQMPEMDRKYQCVVRREDRKNSIEFDTMTIGTYYEGWHDGYSNSQPTNR